MTLTSDELRCLHDVAGELRRSDTSLYRALVTGKLPRSRWSVWGTVYTAGSLLMLTLGALAGASLGSIVLWLTLVTAGTAVIRLQDRSDINR